MSAAEIIARAFHEAMEELDPNRQVRVPWETLPVAEQRVIVAAVNRLIADAYIESLVNDGPVAP